MKLFAPVLLSLVLLIGSLSGQNKTALALLDSVKLVYGSPCEIGVSSPLIDRLRAYSSEYAVKDYLAQFDRLVNALSGCTVKRTLSGNIRVNLDKLYGREQNAINAALLAYQALGAVILDLAIMNGDIKQFYGKEYTFTPIDPLFVFHYSPDSDFYKALFYERIKLN